MARALVIDEDTNHAEQLLGRLQLRSLVVDRVCSLEHAITKLRRCEEGYALVIINTSDASFEWCRALQKLQATCHQSVGRSGPLLLCISLVQQRPEFILQLERTGARFVYER